MQSFVQWTDSWWDRVFRIRLSLVQRLLLCTLIAGSGFVLEWGFSSVTGEYSVWITIISVVSISFLVEAKLAIAFSLVLSMVVDYFFIAPIGAIFSSREAFEHFFFVTSATLFTAFFVSSLRSAFYRLAKSRLEAEHAKFQAQRASQQMEKMLVLVSHDVRNPLSAAKMAAQLLLEHPNHHNQQSLLMLILRKMDRADSLIQTLLDVSTLRGGRSISLQFRYYDLGDDLRTMVEELSLTNEMRLQFVANETFWGLWARDGIRRAVENLVDNALKYGEAKYPVSVTLNRECEDVVISVHNVGNEIATEDQSVLFDFFHRGSSTVTTLKGWGLGLALVKGLAEAHGGSVHVESGAGAGTKFTLKLPIRARPAQDLDRPTAESV